MSTCIECHAEISEQEAYFNQGLCDECAFSTDEPAQDEQAATVTVKREALGYTFHRNGEQIGHFTAEVLLEIAEFVNANRRELDAVISGDNEYLADVAEQLAMQQAEEAAAEYFDGGAFMVG